MSMYYFSRPVVDSNDMVEIMRNYPFGEVLEATYLGGVPNVTYKIVTKQGNYSVRVYNLGYSTIAHIEMEISMLNHIRSTGYDKVPRTLKGNDGKVLQRWRDRWVCASEFIPGTTADNLVISSAICRSVGGETAKLEHALASYKATVPNGETFFARNEVMLKVLPSYLSMRGWEIDIAGIDEQWERCCAQLHESTPHRFLHADVWPPNVLIENEQVSAIIDFDDSCYGPSILELAVPLIEFPMFMTTKVDDNLALALLQGYLSNGGVIDSSRISDLVTAMEIACIGWLACNAVQNPNFDETNIYAQKCALFRDSSQRERWLQKVSELVSQAKGLNS